MSFKKSHMFCGLGELDYSDKKMIQTDILHTYDIELTPRNSILESNPIIFQIDSSNDFTDLSKTFLKLTLSINNAADGSAVAAEDNVSLINNFANSIFSQISVMLKNTTISHPNPNYAYRAFNKKN